MTKREALEKCKDHWQYIADTGSDCKEDYFDHIRIPIGEAPECNCYCCEYDAEQNNKVYSHNCKNCPLNGYAWDNEACLNKSSVYNVWDDNVNYNIGNIEDRLNAARMMVYACDWALSELED